MHKSFSVAAIGLAGMLSLPAVAMPSKFNEVVNGSTFCSLNNEHSVINLDKNGNVQVDRNKNVCITLTKVEDVWKMRT